MNTVRHIGRFLHGGTLVARSIMCILAACPPPLSANRRQECLTPLIRLLVASRAYRHLLQTHFRNTPKQLGAWRLYSALIYSYRAKVKIAAALFLVAPGCSCLVAGAVNVFAPPK